MELYRAIAERYDSIFPLDPAQADFLGKVLEPGCRVLDSGCATGSLAYELAARGFKVMGIDTSAGLIAQAVRRARTLPADSRVPEFRLMDMLDAPKAFPAASFGAVLCLGNTLPHLPGPAEIGACLAGFRSLLEPGGRLVLQLIDFEKVIASGRGGLPAIDNASVRFERDYPGLAIGRSFEFRARLWSKPAPLPAQGSVRLYALSGGELDSLLLSAGFGERSYLSGFSGEGGPGALALVAVAS